MSTCKECDDGVVGAGGPGNYPCSCPAGRLVSRNLAESVRPFVHDDGVPSCSSDCPSYTRRYRKDGQPSQSRPWYCAIDGERHYHTCIPAVRLMARKLKAGGQ